ncbi:MAG: TIGR00725 family protein [Deltaproteobacteria bacterium]|nr:MAG: TIGR00725 family protein [Deltaproteobacteria bacterium]
MKRPLQISVVGAGSADSNLYKLAKEVGEQIALRGGVLVCGGLGGVMEAACRGASEAGGLTVGILPGPEAKEANPWVGVIIPTGIGHARNVLVAQSGDVVIALPGERGTMSEIAIALKTGRPVIGVRAWGDIEGVEVEVDAKNAVAKAFEFAGGER